MRPALILTALLLSLLCRPSLSQTEPPRLLMTLPGEVMTEDAPREVPPPGRLPRAWYAVTLQNGALLLERVVSTRKPDWTLTIRSTTPPGAVREFPLETPSPRHALNMPPGAMLAFRLDADTAQDKDLAFKTGVYPSLLTQPVVLQDRWKAAFASNGKQWTVFTESARRADGALLAGSLALVGDDGTRRLLLPPAGGMAFERQELLWLGRLRPDSDLDLLVKRIWLTGEVEYVLKAGRSLGYAYLDPDRPFRYFSSGVEESESLEAHGMQKRPRPEGTFGSAAFSLGEESWNRALEEAEKRGLPAVLFDRQLSLGDEKMRFTVEYLPRVSTGESAPSGWYTTWLGPVVLKVHFRGRAQVLLQTGMLDGGPFRVQVDRLDGEPAIQAFSPHYNNELETWWVWDDVPRRFLRLYQIHRQGC